MEVKLSWIIHIKSAGERFILLQPDLSMRCLVVSLKYVYDLNLPV